MLEENQRRTRAAGGSLPVGDSRSTVASCFERFEKRQNELWRLTFFILFCLAVAYAWTSKDAIRSFAHGLESLPIWLLVLVVLFAAYMWNKTREISELRGLLHGLEQRDAAPPSGEQLDQLFDIIARSQQGYRDLIDSFDDVLLALTLDGQIRAVNRSFSDLVDTPFQQIIGKQLVEFVQEGTGDGRDLVKRAMPRFMERRQWAEIGRAHV
jgi:PAS domain-containing protein